MIRATYELAPASAAERLAVEQSVGTPDGPARFRAEVLDAAHGRVVVGYPAEIWGDHVALLLAGVVVGEATESREFDRCRLVDLELPAGLLPGPAVGAGASPMVGVIVKPSVGLSPTEVAAVVGAAAGAGAGLVKDDEKAGDRPWCPLDDRVRAVADVLPPGVVYCANVTGPTASLCDRAHRAVELGATGVMVDAFTQGLDAVLALRRAGLGVPVLAHRVGSGPWARCTRFGVAGPVLARLSRWCGADFAIAGAFGGKLFDTDLEVEANVRALRDDCGGTRPSWALLGGGVGPADVAAQVARAGGGGVVALLGSAAYAHPGGLAAGVAAAVVALG